MLDEKKEEAARRVLDEIKSVMKDVRVARHARPTPGSRDVERVLGEHDAESSREDVIVAFAKDLG